MESNNILFSILHRESKSEMKIFLFTFITIVYLAVGQNECLPTTCGPSAPVVRFPFWLKGQQPEHCGYPGFGLSCNEGGRTELDLQFPVTATTNNIVLPLKVRVEVRDIDYKAQKMMVGYPRAQSCLPEKLPTVNSSASPFQVEETGYDEVSTLFNCSNAINYATVACLSNRHYQVIKFARMYEITSLPPYSSCFKMYDISYVPDGILNVREDGFDAPFYLSWSRPSCGKCEIEGKYCRLQNSTAAEEETECFGLQHITGNLFLLHKDNHDINFYQVINISNLSILANGLRLIIYSCWCTNEPQTTYCR